MGVYLNSKKPYLLFQKDFSGKYFVDKSRILQELVPLADLPEGTPIPNPEYADDGVRYLCITRPRRFGKTTLANLISSYFSKAIDSSGIFRKLAVSSYDWFETHLNRHNVIHIAFNELPANCSSYNSYISRIENRLLADLMQEFPDAGIRPDDALWDAFNNIIEFGSGEKFIFVLDEWDFLFHRDFVTEQDKSAHISFLSSLLKDQPYVEMVYMTGILPITKYSSGSELNMFCEYSMAAEERFSTYFGFTDEEVDILFEKFQRENPAPRITREDLRLWYDGYHTKSGVRVYNPRSVVLALANNNLGNYWTSSGPYDEIFYYIRQNTDAVRDSLALMVSGTPVPAKVQEYAATSMELATRDEIFSAMVVYGFLNYADGTVSIPNRELMGQFADMIRKEPSLGYVHRQAKESGRILGVGIAYSKETKRHECIVEILG